MSGQVAPPQPSRFEKLKRIFGKKPSARIDDAYGTLREVGVLQPIFNIRDLEQRRTEVGQILEDLEGKTLTLDIQKSTIDKTFRLFFLAGSPWIRGLDNRELSKKVALFLRLYNDVGSLRAFTPDLFMCSIQLLHLSYQALDVTNTPAYVIQSTPIFTPANVPRIDMRTGERTDARASEESKREEV